MGRRKKAKKRRNGGYQKNIRKRNIYKEGVGSRQMGRRKRVGEDGKQMSHPLSCYQFHPFSLKPKTPATTIKRQDIVILVIEVIA